MAKSNPKTKTPSKRSGKAIPSRAPAIRDRGEIETIARGALIEGGRVLLCKNTKHGYLYLPGGHIEFSESAAGALAREFLEECGVSVSVGALALITEGSFRTRKRVHHELNLVFHVERPHPRSERITSREDGIDFEWVDLASVVDRDVRPDSIKAWLTTLGSNRRFATEWVSEMQA